jgi:hypothetical protein
VFNGRRAVQVTFLIFTTYIVFAIAISIFGKELARNHELLLNIFSHQSSLFGWGYEFTDGRVGQFSIGDNMKDVVNSLKQIEDVRIAVVEDSAGKSGREFVDIDNIPEDVRRLSASTPCGGSRCLYNFTFEDGKIVRIWKGRAMFSGL